MSGSLNHFPGFLGLENNQTLSIPSMIENPVTRLVTAKSISNFGKKICEPCFVLIKLRLIQD